MFLHKNEINELISKSILKIRPLLDVNQVGEISIDLRLGYDFLVATRGREPYIDASLTNPYQKPIATFFQETRRRMGETFVLYPDQIVLTTSLEYVKLPANIFMILNMRSSFNRLGISMASIVQPGYCGCIPLELTNNNKNAIKLPVGIKLIQARLVLIKEDSNYFNSARKYICQVRPEVSAIYQDTDLTTLKSLYNEINNI